MLYMVTFTINIPPMLAYIPYMDPMGNGFKSALQINFFFHDSASGHGSSMVKSLGSQAWEMDSGNMMQGITWQSRKL